MKVIINFSKRWLYTLIAIGILVIVGIGVYALASGIDTSQAYHESTQVSVNISEVEKTLQEAIGDGDFGGLWTQSGNDIYYDNGNIGIGTTSPVANLEINSGISAGNEDTTVRITANSDNPNAAYLDINTISDTTGSDRKVKLNVYDNSENVRDLILQSNYGRVGIGTTSPRSRLSVGGRGSQLYAISASGNYAIFGDGDAIGIRGDGLGYEQNYGVLGGGNFGVYGYGSGYDFYAGGPGTNYGSSSSIRWKTDITEINNALDKILNLRGVYFNWDEEHGGEYDMGMIAEEVGEYAPEIVNYEEDGVYATGMDYGALTPMLVEAIKEQQEIIENQQIQIKDLKLRIEILEN